MTNHRAAPAATDRLMFRALELTDLNDIFNLRSDPLVCQYFYWEPQGMLQSLNYIAASEGNKFADRIGWVFAIIRSSDGRLIGDCSIHGMDLAQSDASIGYMLSPDVWGQGFATEAAKSLVAFGLGTLGLKSLRATCDANNQASVRVLEKAGLQRVPMLTDRRTYRGEEHEILHFLLRAPP